MKKKLLTVAMAATMVIGSVFSAFAEETKVDTTTLAADSYTEQANPLQGKNAETVTITYTINWDADAPRNGWDGIFSFFDAASGGRVSFQTAPYLCFNAGADDKWIDLKADAWCTANCEPGTDYTFQYVITKDSISVTCDGTQIAEFTEVGRGAGAAEEGFQEVLDALNTYPTLTIGVGIGQSSYWNTEPATISITINDGAAAPAGDDQQTAGDDQQATDAPAGTDAAPATADTAPIVMVAGVALAACAVVLATKKSRVTE